MTILDDINVAQGDLSRLANVQQEDPLLSLIAEWNRTLRSYERDITCDEGSDVLQALTQLAEEVKAQWLRDELALKSGTKKLKQVKLKATPQAPTGKRLHDVAQGFADQ